MTAVTARARRTLLVPVIALLLSLGAAGASAAAPPAKGTEILWDKWGNGTGIRVKITVNFIRNLLIHSINLL